MFHQIRRSHLIVMLTLLMALLISVSWANVGVSPVRAHTTSSQSNNIGPSPTPTPALTCGGGMQQSISRPADSSRVIVKVGDFVWLDGDGDGIQDVDEQGVPDITCGVCEEGISGPALDIDTTDAMGAYELDISLSTEGDYYLICASLSEEYAFTDKDAGDDDSVDSDFASVANEDYALFGQTDTFLVVPGQPDDDTIDAGLVLSPINTPTPTNTPTATPSPTPTSTPTVPPVLTCESGLQQSISRPADSSRIIVKVGDFVWLDGDGDGIQDVDEQGVPDITCAVCEEGESGPPEDITTTDANGAYELDISLSTEGNYYLICASLSEEYTFTDKDAGDDDSVDSDFAAVANEDYALFGQTDPFLVIPGQDDDYTIDAGLVLLMTNTPTPTATSTTGPSPTPTATSTTGPSPTPTATSTTGPSPTPSATSTTGPSPTPTATSTSVTLDIGPTMGGTLTYTDEQGNDTTIEVPEGAVGETTSLVYTPNMPETNPANFSFAGHAFNLEAVRNNEPLQDLTFTAPVVVTINYSDEDVAGLDENSLLLHYFDEETQQWIDAATTCDPNSTYQRDPANNRVSVAICHLTDFGLFGTQMSKNNVLYLPVIQR